MCEVKNFQGEKAVFLEGYAYFCLKRPYRLAGRRFGWNPPVAGLSLNAEILREAFRRGCKVRVFVGEKWDRCFECDPGLWLMRGSRHEVKGVQLYCLPWRPAFFKTIKNFPIEIAKCFQEGEE